jgi:hypothetical protein
LRQIRRVSRPCVCLVIAFVLVAGLQARADAAQRAEISAGFTPERLGSATALSFGFQLTNGRRVPAALSSMQIGFPVNLGLGTSGLGVASCSPGELEVVGPEACPANSRMGSGSATVEIELASETVVENVSLEVFAAPSTDGYLHVVVYVNAVTPVFAQVLLSGVVLPGRLSILVPPIPSFPEAPDIAVARLRLTIGGHLTYYERVKGRLVAYHPAGVGLPSRCPHGGFPFAATFGFIGGGEEHARTVVPCPSHR